MLTTPKRETILKTDHYVNRRRTPRPGLEHAYLWPGLHPGRRGNPPARKRDAWAPPHTSIYPTQLDAYHRLVDNAPEQFRLIRTRGDLEGVLADWEQPGGEAHQVGLAVLMEGAEGGGEPAELEGWWARGGGVI